jgi:hypothetical protein
VIPPSLCEQGMGVRTVQTLLYSHDAIALFLLSRLV